MSNPPGFDPNDPGRSFEGGTGYRTYLAGGHPTNATPVTSPVVRPPSGPYEPSVIIGNTVVPALKGGPYSVDPSRVTLPSSVDHIQQARPGYRLAPIPPRDISDNNNLFTTTYALGRYTNLEHAQYTSGGRLLYHLTDPISGASRLQFGSVQGGQHRIVN